MGRVAGRGMKSQAKPNPKMYQAWIEYDEIGRTSVFLGNSHTMRVAERRLSFRQYMRYKQDGGRFLIHCPDRE